MNDALILLVVVSPLLGYVAGFVYGFVGAFLDDLRRWRR